MTAQELGNRPASEMTRREVIVLAFTAASYAAGNTVEVSIQDGKLVAGMYLVILAREAQEAGDER